MLTLQEQITQDRDAARLSGDKFTLKTLQMLIGDIQNAEKAGKTARAFTDADVITALIKARTQRLDTAGIYAEAGEVERADAENKEAEIISRYLPTPLTTDELTKIVNEEIEKQGATSRKQMGLVIKAVSARVGGGATGKEISSLVMSRLS